MGAAGLAPAALRFLPMLLKTRVGRVVLIGGIVLLVGGRMLGIDVLSLVAGGGAVAPSTAPAELSEADREAGKFVSVVLASTEDAWHGIFQRSGRQYVEPTLVLFNNRVSSACGMASSAVGPFYCPGDQQLYIDLSFFRDLAQRHGAPGDFAQAYVVAHEVGHHVQTLLGISEQVHTAKRGRSEAEANALSVKQELQADCFAGLWGHIANQQRQWLEPGDLDEALAAATAIGDDRLQRDAGRQVVPDSFTHGTSAQRVKWFRTGFEGGNFDACDTFAARNI
ncbi:MAG: neutral zinc metallopeptidase [Halioglobus sp.]